MAEQAMLTLFFKHRGTFSFEDFYKGTRKFFIDRKMEVTDTKHKQKADEIEGKIEAKVQVDIYSKYLYLIEYKIIEVKFITIEEHGKKIPMIEGRIWLMLEVKCDYNYTEESFTDKRPLFDEKKPRQKWWHKIYAKLTFRDRDEDTEGEAIITAHQYIEFLKELCNEQTRN